MPTGLAYFGVILECYCDLFPPLLLGEHSYSL